MWGVTSDALDVFQSGLGAVRRVPRDDDHVDVVAGESGSGVVTVDVEVAEEEVFHHEFIQGCITHRAAIKNLSPALATFRVLLRYCSCFR
jgi:hypothetical protein